MALNVAALPLILYRIRYKTIEHVLHYENIIHVPTLLHYFLQYVPFLLYFFHFQYFFTCARSSLRSLCHCAHFNYFVLWSSASLAPTRHIYMITNL